MAVAIANDLVPDLSPGGLVFEEAVSKVFGAEYMHTQSHCNQLQRKYSKV